MDEETLHLRAALELSLQQVWAGTHSEHINPARDGVKARLRKILKALASNGTTDNDGGIEVTTREVTTQPSFETTTRRGDDIWNPL